MIRIGELKDSIEIQTRNLVYDENYGVETETFETLYKLRAKMKTVSTKEYISANAETTNLRLKFICRNRNINSDNFVLYKNEKFNIKHVHIIDSSYMELTCEKVD